jgi:membrane protease YdiL (CAAX protease family)
MGAMLLTQVCIALLSFTFLILIQGRRILAYGSLLALFFAVYFGDNIILVLANRFSSLRLIPNHAWEEFLVCGWSGKLYSVLFALALLYICRTILTTNDVGLTLHQSDGSLLPTCMVVLALAVWSYIVGISSPKGEPDPKTLLYLAVMPGLNEELIYRGYLLGILDKLMPSKLRLFAAPVGWGAIVTSLLFGLLHGFWLDSSLTIHINVIALRNAAISGFIFAWLRERTGSLMMPIVAHGVEDLLFFLPRMI